MTRRALLALALLLPLAAPAAGDHVYSHRYVLEGRLMGNDGAPLPGRAVEFVAEGDDFFEPCAGTPLDARTDASGDFRFCFHKHDLKASARVGVRAGNASAMRQVDTALRRTVVTLVEPNETGVAPPDWNLTHLVAGRVWRQGPGEMEGVRVFGETSPHVLVNLTMRTGVDAGSNFQAQTDAYGDFRFLLRLLREEDAANVTLDIEALGHRQPTRTLDLDTHRLTVGILLPRAFPGDVAPAQVDLPPAAPQPGTTTPPVHPALFVFIALGLVASILLSRRKKD